MKDSPTSDIIHPFFNSRSAPTELSSDRIKHKKSSSKGKDFKPPKGQLILTNKWGVISLKRPDRANKSNNEGKSGVKDKGEIESNTTKNSSSETIKAPDPGIRGHSTTSDKVESQQTDSEEV